MSNHNEISLNNLYKKVWTKKIVLLRIKLF